MRAGQEQQLPHPVGIGLIGCGSNGQIHADGLAKLAAEGEIRAVIAGDPLAPSREAAQRNCAFETLTGAPEEVASHPDVEAVLVAGPTASHGGAIRAALASGKAVMCEKPLASSFGEVVSLVDAVVASGVVAQVGFQSRFNPVYSWLREVIAEGTFGTPLGYMLREDQFWPTGSVVPGHSSWRSDPAQSGGGPLLEHSIHACDLLVWMFGPVTSVSARTASLFGFGVEDIAAGHVQHGNGVIGTVTTVFNGVEGREERRLEVFLEQATIELTGDFIVGAHEEAVIVHRPGVADETVDLAGLRHAAFAGAGISRRDFIFYQYVGDRAFVHAVRGGTPGQPGFGDALAAHVMVEAAYRSAAAGGVPVDCADLA
jgi:1,5-anhydro-D-fructose reductase (1,5-anhydro-D-mannitol-forming)